MNLELSLSIIFRTVESALFSSAGGLWYVTVKYGLSPGYAYLGSELSAHGYLRIYNFFFNTFVSEIVYLVMILAALYLLFRNSVGEPAPSIPTLARLFFSFSLAIFAFTVCIDLMRYTDSIYTYTWNGLDTDWYALMPLGSSSNATGIQDLGSTTVISLLFITSYFVATGSLLSMLEIRQAIILVLMVILPVSSLLLALPFTEKIAAGMWKLFAEMTVVPFIVLICIAIAESVHGDPLLQIALILLASGSPFLLHNGSRILYGAGIMGSFTGLMAGMGSMRYGITGQVAGISSALKPSLGVAIKGGRGPIDTNKQGEFTINWREVFRDSFRGSGERRD